jgi:hypothetical protein
VSKVEDCRSHLDTRSIEFWGFSSPLSSSRLVCPSEAIDIFIHHVPRRETFIRALNSLVNRDLGALAWFISLQQK